MYSISASRRLPLKQGLKPVISSSSYVHIDLESRNSTKTRIETFPSHAHSDSHYASKNPPLKQGLKLSEFENGAPIEKIFASKIH